MKAGVMLSLLGLVLPAMVAFADHHDYMVERIQHPDLIPGFIASVVQDHQGFIWLATSDGLYRHDGKRFVAYKSEVRNSHSLPNNNVRNVFVDSQGGLWVLSQGGGLTRYNRSENNFTTFLPQDDNSESVSGTFDFWSIHEHEGLLYISSHGGNGFFIFDPLNETFTLKRLPVGDYRHFVQTNAVKRSSNGDFWIGTDNSGLMVLRNDERIYRITAESGLLATNRIRALFFCSDQVVWVGLSQGGLQRFRTDTMDPLGLPGKLVSIEGLERSTVFDIVQDNHGSLWIATSIGIVVYDPHRDAVINHYQHIPANPRSLSSNLIRSIYEDRSGVIWVGTQNGGLNRLTNKQNFINILPAQSSPSGVLANPIVRAITLYNDALWIGTEGGGIHILDTQQFTLLDQITTSSRQPARLQSDEITTFTPDPDGGLWVGTWGGGLHYLSPESSRFTVFRHSPDDEQSLSDDRIQFLHIDSRGEYWVGTENGLNHFNREEATFTRIKHVPSDPSSLSGNSLQTLAFVEESPGVFWVGSWQGLNLLNTHTGQSQRFLSDPVNPNSLSIDHVISLHKDGQYLWIGTFGGGLNRLNTQTGEFIYFTELTGLPNNVIFAILADHENNLWLSSSRGLSRFNPERQTFVNFTESDGLQGNDYWWGSAYQDTLGRMYFGGTNGLTILDPTQLMERDYQPNLVLSSVTIDSDLPLRLTSGSTLTLTPDNSILTIEFAALDYSDPGKIQYAYLMEGLTRDWNYSGNRSIVSFASMPPGRYRFMVRGTNSAGNWSEHSAVLTVIVQPRFFQTRWFAVLGTLFTVGGIVFGFLYWSRLSRQRQAELEAMVDDRTQDLETKREELLQSYAELRGQTVKLQEKNAQVAQQNAVILAKSKELESINKQLLTINQEKNSLIGIVAHDLRSPAASVLSALQLLQLQPDLSYDEQLELFKTMEEFLNKQLAMVSRILDYQVLESGVIDVRFSPVTLNRFCEKLVATYQKKAAPKRISIQSKWGKQSISVETDENLLEQIIDNLLSNAVKFSPVDSTVTLIMDVQTKSVRLGVRDQGPGLTKEDLHKLFGKFQRLSARPTGGEQTTGLGLSIVKRFVTAIKGEVYCETEFGNGATFWVEIPR